MRIVFAGTPEFSVPALRALYAEGHEITAVYTQPDRPAGRGRRPVASPVKQEADKLGIPVEQPSNLRDSAAQQRLRDIGPELMVVVAYGLILPPVVLDIPTYGCLNIHASLLPRWRGAAPIQRAIEAGDRETGITIMQMDAGLDTGDMLRRQALVITPTDTSQTLHDRLAELGAREIVEVVGDLDRFRALAVSQDDAASCYAHKLEKHEGIVDWNDDSEVIARRIRAFTPWPGVHARHGDVALRIWQARATTSDALASPGTVLASGPGGIIVRCGAGALVIEKLQRAGGRALNCADFLNGTPLPPGARLAGRDDR